MTPPSPSDKGLREEVAAKLLTQAERREANARYLRHSIGDEVKDTRHRVLAEASEADAALFRQAAELLSLPALSLSREGWRCFQCGEAFTDAVQ